MEDDKIEFVDITPGPNYQKIDAIWAFISADKDGDGIIGQQFDGVMMPFVASDEKRIKDLMPFAKSIANMAKTQGKKIKLVKFTKREEIEVL